MRIIQLSLSMELGVDPETNLFELEFELAQNPDRIWVLINEARRVNENLFSVTGLAVDDIDQIGYINDDPAVL